MPLCSPPSNLSFARWSKSKCSWINLVTRLEDHNVINSNTEDFERKVILMNLRRRRGISTRPIRDMNVTFISNPSSDEGDTEQRSNSTGNDRFQIDLSYSSLFLNKTLSALNIAFANDIRSF
ncbi:hypothetical protein ACOME3_010322 [Neoechinorhynchus agilis]